METGASAPLPPPFDVAQPAISAITPMTINARNPPRPEVAGARNFTRSTLRCLRAITEEEQRAADFDAVAAFKRIAAADRLAVDENLSAAGRSDEEILALVADDRVMCQHRLIAEEADIAFLGAPDNRDVLDQRVFAPLAGVATLRAHHHQPSAFEQFADETDKEAY